MKQRPVICISESNIPGTPVFGPGYLHRLMTLWMVSAALLSIQNSFAMPADTPPTFEHDVLIVLKDKCLSCHGESQQKNNLDLRSLESLLKGGKNGPSVQPGNLEKSLIWQKISQMEMPPEGETPLTDSEKERIRLWVLNGLFPNELSTVRDPDHVSAEDRLFWSFVKPARSSLPTVKNENRVSNPIDRFVLAKLEQHHLTFNPEADRRILIRRLYFNLTGLAPVPSDIDDFITDPNPFAYERLVDRLLTSSSYGERWARHWLDVAGYSESSLFIGDQLRPDFWRYRDYVIRSFNTDKPYNQFVMEQLAGDEMFDWRATDVFSENQKDKLIATGFLRCPPDATDNQPITQNEKIYATQQAVLEVSMKALLGLTLNCVRCHSHKYDPIPHTDYYRLMAVFQPAFDPEKWLPGIYSRAQPGPIRAIPLTERKHRTDYLNRSLKWKPESWKLRKEVRYGLPNEYRDRYLKQQLPDLRKLPDYSRLADILESDSRTKEEEEYVARIGVRLKINRSLLIKTYPEFEDREKQIQKRIQAIQKENGDLPPVAWGVYDVSTSPSPTRLLQRGNHETPGVRVKPGVLTVLDDPSHPFSILSPESRNNPTSTGRRLQLARWMTNPSHPLTARVLVNRIWQYHFGTGIVATPDDFGSRGSPPTHPELLDWLTVEFMENNWSIRHIHRLILNSTTYRQSSNPSSITSPDPSNQLLSHFPKHRLEAEAIRDVMLKISGRLNDSMYGKSVPVKKQKNGMFVVDPEHPECHRRTIYVSTRRTWVPSFLSSFDAPIMDTNWPKRSESAIPQQALALMNNRFSIECSAAFNQRVMQEPEATFEARLIFAYRHVYGRDPSDEESHLFRSMIQPDEHPPGSPENQKAWQLACQALLSSNEFMYID